MVLHRARREGSETATQIDDEKLRKEDLKLYVESDSMLKKNLGLSEEGWTSLLATLSENKNGTFSMDEFEHIYVSNVSVNLIELDDEATKAADAEKAKTLQGIMAKQEAKAAGQDLIQRQTSDKIAELLKQRTETDAVLKEKIVSILELQAQLDRTHDVMDQLRKDAESAQESIEIMSPNPNPNPNPNPHRNQSRS